MDEKMNDAIASAPPPSYSEAIPTDYMIMNTTEIVAANIDEKRTKLNALCVQHNINPVFSPLLWNLNEKHIIFLCDDSGSMNATVNSSNKTRWDELKHVVTEVLDISLIFDPIGMDVHFLNRTSIMNLRDVNKLVPYFRNSPSGGTPLVTKLNEISRMYQTGPGIRFSKLLIIATDGEPSDDDPHYPGLKNVMRQLVEQGYHIAFLICTDNASQVEYINDIDRLYQQVDVTDDYITEKHQIQRVQGRNFKFSYGDYIVKLLVGSIDSTLDSLDERKLQHSNRQTNTHSRQHRFRNYMCNIL